MPEGATVLEPVGTAPGLVVPPARRPCSWSARAAARAAADVGDGAGDGCRCARCSRGAGTYEQRIMRLFGIPESEIARSLREIEADGVPIDRLEITTCLRRGEIEIATVFEPPAAEVYDAFEAGDPRAPRRHAVLRGRLDGRRPGDRAAGGAHAWRWRSPARAG